MTSEAKGSGIRSALELVGGITAVLAVLGYASVRAWLNRLGIKDPGSLPLEVYLYEAYLIILSIIGLLAPLAGFVLLCFATYAFVHQALPKCIRVTDLSAYLDSTRAGAGLLVAGSVAAICVAVATLPGEEQADTLLKPGRFMTGGSSDLLLFSILIVLTGCVIAIALSPPILRSSRLWLGATLTIVGQAVAMIAAVVLAWGSILVFNVQVKELKFPLAMLKQKGASRSICGLLVLSTGDDYILWRYINEPFPMGEFLLARRNDVSVLYVGRELFVSEFVEFSRSAVPVTPVQNGACLERELPTKVGESEAHRGGVRSSHFSIEGAPSDRALY